jgi:hypothetical protein
MAECETDGNKDHVPHHPAQTSIDPKTNVASLNEKEENVINVWGFETLLGKRGVQIMLHYERKKSHSMVPAGNLETKRSEG